MRDAGTVSLGALIETVHPDHTMAHERRAPLELLLAADGDTIPNWLFQCLTALERSGVAKVVTVVRPVREDGRAHAKSVGLLRHVLFFLYTNLDRALFHGSADALDPVSLQATFPDCPVCSEAEFREQRIDVVLDPFRSLSNPRWSERSRYGIWTTTIGETDDPRTLSTPAFWEVVDGRPTTETRLCVERKDADGRRVIHVSVASTDRRSVSRSQNRVYWKMAAALAAKLRLLREDPDAFLDTVTGAPPARGARPACLPRNREMVPAFTRLARRLVADKWRTAVYREQWALAYHRGVADPPPAAFRQLIPPADRLWADPFPVSAGPDCYIFHEEAPFSTGKGSIVVTVVDDAGRIAGPIPVLETEYHLSYPYVFEWDGDFFMIPETGAHHQVELYRCIEFPSRWKLERVLIVGLIAYDPTIVSAFGKWWLFASVPAYPGGSSDELHLFHADSPVGPWTPHRQNPLKSDVRAARPAGRIFERGGQLYRPAQDCSVRYGYGVSINRILQLNVDSYDEAEAYRILPDWAPNVIGVHTFNRAGDMTVIDCLLRHRRRVP